MLQVEGLTKRYGERIAVAGISFAVARGETVGLLGPNGAGKTSTIAMLCGIATRALTLGGASRCERVPRQAQASAWCRRTWRSTTNCPPGPTCSCSAGSTAWPGPR